jgi:Phage tail tube protein
MTTYQSQSNGYVAYKVQSGLGSQASGSGGTILRQAGGAGANLTKAATESNEVRRDGMRMRGRHGIQKTTGAWIAEASLGSHEEIIQAVMRDTWDTSALTLTQSDFTSLAIASNVVTLGSGNPASLGLRVGDVIRFANLSATANNSKNCRIISMTSTTFTVAETLTDMGADTTCSITRPKKLIQYSASSIVKRYYTIDEYDVDIDQSTVLTDFVWGSIKFSMAPNGLLMADPGGVGTGQISALATGSSPLLTSPSETTAPPFSVVDMTIRVNGIDVVELTNFDLTLDITPNAPDVFGSGAIKYSPDVFTGQMAVSMNLTALRKNLTYLSDFIAETVYSLHILAVENESEPKDFLSIYVGNFTLGGDTRSALSKQGGALTETISIPAALVGKDTTGTGYDATMVKFQGTGV